jgi:8-oxo-dGTP pyrophosphatase MutT (NUDIX family)
MLSLEEIASKIQPIIAKPQTIFLPHYDDKLSRSAAVMIIFHYNYKTPHILLTKRSSGLQFHKSEISFPGGRYSLRDKSLRHTAIRETKEEIGLLLRHKDIIGSLTTVSTLTSNFMITPFVTLQHKIPQLKILSCEVERLIDAPVFELLDTMTLDLDHYNSSANDVYKFEYKNDIVWGATAKILRKLYEVLL